MDKEYHIYCLKVGNDLAPVRISFEPFRAITREYDGAVFLILSDLFVDRCYLKLFLICFIKYGHCCRATK